MCCAFRKITPGTFPPVFFFFKIPLPLSYPHGDGDGDRFPQNIYIPPRGELRILMLRYTGTVAINSKGRHTRIFGGLLQKS